MIRSQTVSDAKAKPGEAAIDVAGLSKSYVRGQVETSVLADLNLTVARGECVFLAGPSGSGKSTLLAVLGCILTPDRGRVSILGQDLAELDPSEQVAMRRDRIGFVFQRFQLLRGLTATDNVMLPLVLRGISQSVARRRARDLLDVVGLADRVAAIPQRLSAGQCQRVALARAMANDPELILADEPTASLDAVNGQQVIELLKKLVVELGKTAVVVTHDQRIFPFADRVCYLDNGRIAAEETGAAACAQADAYPLPPAHGPLPISKESAEMPLLSNSAISTDN